MKKMISFLLALMLFVPAIQAEKWTVDGTHSSVNFSVSHLVISKTRGEFKDFSGDISFSEKEIETSSVEFNINVTSIDTEDEGRDDHLRNADFFDVEKYPTMTFKSNKVIKGKESDFKLIGDLTIKDVTKEVTFDCTYAGTVNDPWGNTKSGFSAETKINRQDFNVKFSKVLETGGLVVGDEISIVLEIEANLVK